MKQAVTLLVTILLLVSTLICSASAAEVQPQANLYFASASVAFDTRGYTVFSAFTTYVADRIAVASCSLQVEDGDSWETIQYLNPPGYVAMNTVTYSAEKTFSLNCESGKNYRIKAVFSADGHTVVRYSNELDDF
jgi:hypothetical protein